MSVGAALAKAGELAKSEGFDGFEVRGAEGFEDIAKSDLAGAFEEISRLIDEGSHFATANAASGVIHAGRQSAGVGLASLSRLRERLMELVTTGHLR